MRRKALVAGALGMVGGHVAAHLSTCADWEVVGLSRGEPRREIGWRMRRVDLADADACRELVASEPGVTHLFHAARAPHADPAVEARTNLAMLAHLVDALEAGGSLRHVCLIQGSKWY
ncbi:MAG TPA: NAD-dependent epimerase/dehydratase family protein, partial [Burkholderiaceae bacterium]|nr:NAD-dependent epimerase/dehydratase family protein [Burkholderiaceae bacterium]